MLWALTVTDSSSLPLNSVRPLGYNAFYCLHACGGDKSPGGLKGLKAIRTLVGRVFRCDDLMSFGLWEQ